MRELNVVISGFDHYDGVEVNPAVEVPKAIAEQGLGVSSAPDDRHRSCCQHPGELRQSLAHAERDD